MTDPERNNDHAIRENAYYIWEREGRPEGRDWDHWLRAASERVVPTASRDQDAMDDEEKLLAGRHDVNIPALLTRDVLGG